MKKIISIILTICMLATGFLISDIEADAADTTATPVWVCTGNDVYNLSGTDIVATFKDGVLAITGNGRLPDYTIKNYRYRPWNGRIVSKVEIAETITYIGTYEFYNIPYLKEVSFYLSTFVADRTSFKDLYNVRYRIKGSAISTVYIGKLPYTSLNSIEFMAYNKVLGQSYIFDTQQLAAKFQNSSSPSIINVFYIGQSNEPWLNLNEYSNGYKVTNLLSISEATPMKDCEVSTQIFFPTMEVYQAMANNIGDYELAFTFSATVTRLEKYTMTNTLYQYQYSLTIPTQYQAPGRTFKLMQMSATGVKILDDLDINDSTVTFATNEPTVTYALIYK